MSRIGKKPITVPAGVEVTIDPKALRVSIKGPKGQLAFVHRPEVEVRWNANERSIVCSIPESLMEEGEVRAFWGTTRARIQTMITGVTTGYERKLEIVGVGWNAQAQGKVLKLNIGFCHPVEMTPEPGVSFAVSGQIVTITGPDKHAVGQFAANVRAKRPPEPYNGKGIKYVDETIIRKQGKVFGS